MTPSQRANTVESMEKIIKKNADLREAIRRHGWDDFIVNDPGPLLVDLSISIALIASTILTLLPDADREDTSWLVIGRG